MRFFVLPAICAMWALSACSQAPVMASSFSDKAVEVGCATCIYDISGVKRCQLATSIDGREMLMTGVDVDLHDHDLCSGPTKAVVTGTIKGDTVVASTIDFE